MKQQYLKLQITYLGCFHTHISRNTATQITWFPTTKNPSETL